MRLGIRGAGACGGGTDGASTGGGSASGAPASTSLGGCEGARAVSAASVRTSASLELSSSCVGCAGSGRRLGSGGGELRGGRLPGSGGGVRGLGIGGGTLRAGGGGRCDARPRTASDGIASGVDWGGGRIAGRALRGGLSDAGAAAGGTRGAGGASDGNDEGFGTRDRVGGGVPPDVPSGSVGRALGGDDITIVRSPESVPGSESGIANIAAPHVAHCMRSMRPRALTSATEYLEPHFEHVIFIATSPGTDLGARDPGALDHTARTGRRRSAWRIVQLHPRATRSGVAASVTRRRATLRAATPIIAMRDRATLDDAGIHVCVAALRDGAEIRGGVATISTQDAPRSYVERDRTELDRIEDAELARHPARARLVRGARMVGVALIAAMAGYVAGRIHGAIAVGAVEAQLERMQADHAQAISSAEQHAGDASARAARAEQHVQLLEGAQRITAARRALDARNFGIAEASLRDAERGLRPLEQQVEGLAPIVASLATTRVVVAEDLATQRAELDALSDRLDALLASMEPRAG
ncbi:hypothetical protein [Sandaracinus amylolyticus]|uniref:hypothetical protein n=1 Tax=Sandaracinus amylolyticus TaxID=927083 RepID=UPI001F3BCBFC|nr:hypothetical protein [Sandaracinus amylolyticus]